MTRILVVPTPNGSEDISYQLLSDTKVFQGANLEAISPLHYLIALALFTQLLTDINTFQAMTIEGIQTLSILMDLTIFLINFLVISTDSKA